MCGGLSKCLCVSWGNDSGWLLMCHCGQGTGRNGQDLFFPESYYQCNRHEMKNRHMLHQPLNNETCSAFSKDHLNPLAVWLRDLMQPGSNCLLPVTQWFEFLGHLRQHKVMAKSLFITETISITVTLCFKKNRAIHN